LAECFGAYNRQACIPEEVSRIKGQLTSWPKSSAFSRAGERRLAKAQAYFVDEQFRQVIESQGFDPGLKPLCGPLGIALAPLAQSLR